jgi:hypothetical protein
MEIRLEKIKGEHKDARFVFDECDLSGVAIGLADYRASDRGTEATVTIDSLRSDTKVIYPGHSSFNVLLEMLQERVASLCVNEVEVEKVKMDSVDESLLKDPQPALSLDDVELMRKRGYDEGAVLVIGNGYDVLGEVSYGVLADIWKDPKMENIIFIRLTDGRIVDAVDCQVANDVNKDILRMVEAEKGRVMEQAIKFTELMDQKVDEIIFG